MTVRANERLLPTVTDILDHEGTVEMAERESTWRKDGWTGRYTEDGGYAPGTTGSMAPGAVGAAASTTTGLGTGGTTGIPPRRVATYPAIWRLAEEGRFAAIEDLEVGLA